MNTPFAGGVTSDSVKLYYFTNIKIHGLTGHNYDIKKIWSDDVLLCDPWVAGRWSRNYYLAHARYLHAADNEGYVLDSDDDPARKTRAFREMLQSISQNLVSLERDLAIDEGILDTESTKVPNRQRVRFKPSANEGVTVTVTLTLTLTVTLTLLLNCYMFHVSCFMFLNVS